MTNNKDPRKISSEETKTPLQNTRDHLLEIGLRLIRSNGYASTGMTEILQAADVPKGSFYHHFASKEAYASEVLKLYVYGENQRIERVLYDRKVSPLKRLRGYFEELIRVYGPSAEISGCLIGNLSLEMADRSDSMQLLLRKAFATWQDAIADVLREAVERGDLPHSAKPEDLASFLLDSYQGALIRSKADRSAKSIEIFLHFIFTVLLTNDRKG